MLKNYFKIAWRNLQKNKISSLINAVGLAIGMASAILIGLWIYDEISFNKNFKNCDLIARVMKNANYEGTLNTDGSCSIPLGDYLKANYKNDFDYVVKYLDNINQIISIDEKKFAEQGSYMDAEAPDLLGLRMIAGNRNGLTDPTSVMLSNTFANKIYGKTDPINKILKINDAIPVKVTGVYEDFPDNSDFKAVSFILPFDLWVTSKQYGMKLKTDWNSEFIGILVQINKNAKFATISEKIKDISLHNISTDRVAQRPSIFLHPMPKWHLYSNFENGVNKTSDQLGIIWVYATIGLFVLLIACINFMNLSTARSEKRGKEIGIRKAIGSLRSHLIVQFISESIVIATFAFVFAICLVLMILPWFNRVSGKNIAFFWNSPMFWLVGIIFTFVTGLLAGTYPAFYLSSLNVVKVLKGSLRAGPVFALPRKILVVLQFSVSVALIIATIVILQQIKFAKDRPVGYTRNGLLSIQMTSPETQRKFSLFMSELKNTGVVQEVAQSQSPLTDIWNTSNGFRWSTNVRDTTEYFGTIGVSYEFGQTINWQIYKGRDFMKNLASDSAGIIINESALRLMNLKDPVGKIVTAGATHYKILGVCKDVVMRSPFKQAFPTIYYLGNGNWTLIRISENVSIDKAIAKIETVWKNIFPSFSFDFKFADENYAAKFAAEEKIGSLVSFFAILAIFISCLGLFGLASFLSEQRTKEICLRKVLGASTWNLWLMLSKSFVFLIILSWFIAIPISYYILFQWLQKYEYRITISFWILLIASIGSLLLTMVTVSYQTIKLARSNPVFGLRQE